MNDLNLPGRSRRIGRTTTNGAAPPLDPVGTAVAEFLVDLLDGIVVSLVYAHANSSPPAVDRTTGAITSRQGPARTAAARSLSRFARVVLKVSEDGPVSVFKYGVEVTRILA